MYVCAPFSKTRQCVNDALVLGRLLCRRRLRDATRARALVSSLSPQRETAAASFVKALCSSLLVFVAVCRRRGVPNKEFLRRSSRTLGSTRWRSFASSFLYRTPATSNRIGTPSALPPVLFYYVLLCSVLFCIPVRRGLKKLFFPLSFTRVFLLSLKRMEGIYAIYNKLYIA